MMCCTHQQAHVRVDGLYTIALVRLLLGETVSCWSLLVLARAFRSCTGTQAHMCIMHVVIRDPCTASPGHFNPHTQCRSVLQVFLPCVRRSGLLRQNSRCYFGHGLAANARLCAQSSE